MLLLRQRLQRPSHWAALGPYWASLPPAGALYCKELAHPHHAAELQDVALARAHIILQGSLAQAVFVVTAPSGQKLHVQPRSYRQPWVVNLPHHTQELKRATCSSCSQIHVTTSACSLIP